MYYANYIEQLEGVPHKIRADRGVENAYVAGIQRFPRRSHNDESAGYSSFIFGKSTSNQRIEAWWSLLRRNRLNWWMNYFKDLHDQGLYDDSNPTHVQCLKFCFYSILQDELDETRHYWNHLRIRLSRAASSPPGRPDVLYFLPQNQNTLDHKLMFDEEKFLLAKSLYCRNNPIFRCDDEFLRTCLYCNERKSSWYANERGGSWNALPRTSVSYNSNIGYCESKCRFWKNSVYLSLLSCLQTIRVSDRDSRAVIGRICHLTGAVEGAQDWSDHLKRTSIWQLLVRPEHWNHKALTINNKIFGPIKVGVVGPAPPALLDQSSLEPYWLACRFVLLALALLR